MMASSRMERHGQWQWQLTMAMAMAQSMVNIFEVICAGLS
jgi:hypothetical protein